MQTVLAVVVIQFSKYTCYYFRWYHPGSVGGRHRFNSSNICERLCNIYNNCVCTFLAHGLSQHRGSNQDGY